MKHLTMIAAIMTLVAIPTFAAESDNTRRLTQGQINRAERRETRQDIEKLIQDINTLDNQPAARRAGVAEAARQAAVPPGRFLTPPKDQPKAGLAGQFLAQEIAKNTKKSPEEILNRRVAGETWTQIAQENRQDLTALERKLTRIHEAMLDPTGDSARARERASAADRDAASSQQKAAAPGDSSFDKSIQAVNALGQDQEARRLGLNAIAREIDLPRQQVEQAAEQNKQMGLGDLFVAQQLSLKTKKPISELWNMHLSPKSWDAIAQDSYGSANQLERQLARVEDTMRGRTARADDAERVRERDQRRLDRIDSTRNIPFDEPTFERSIQSVNSLGQNADVRRAGLRALSRETGTPLSQVELADQQHRNLGMGDLFIAQELSAKTKKSVDELWKLHLSPQTWAQIARDHNQDLSELQRKLARIEQALRDTGK
jgi:hypothetical protein